MKDKKIEELIKAEIKRQSDGLEMIPSENHTSADVLSALGSRLTDKYSEGYPGARLVSFARYPNDFADTTQEMSTSMRMKSCVRSDAVMSIAVALPVG